MSPSRYDRIMLHVDAGTHPKFARLTDSEWRATIGGVFPLAGMSPIRGCLLVADAEPVKPIDVATRARVSVRVAKSAMQKLRAVGVIEDDPELNCERVHDFNEWNPAPKVDRTSAERQARHRAKLKAGRNGSNAVTNGVVTPDVTPEVTPTEGVKGEGLLVCSARATGLHPQLQEVIDILNQLDGLTVEPQSLSSALSGRKEIDPLAGAHRAVEWAARPDVTQRDATTLMRLAYGWIADEAAKREAKAESAAKREDARPPRPFGGRGTGDDFDRKLEAELGKDAA